MHSTLRLAAALTLLTGGTCLAQTYPMKTVRILVQSPPGGVQDLIARATAQELSKLWGQGVIVENRPSAGGILAAETVARAPADGYTVLQTGGGTVLANEFLRKSLPYDSYKDFAPVVILIASNNIMVASPKLPASNMRELIALARAKPGALNYASLGIGHNTHIDTAAILREAGAEATHVPYKGGTPALQAMASGEVDFGITGITAAIPLVRQGRLKALAYTGLKRSELFPDLPTLAESGFPGFESGSWFGWFVPAGTPRAIIDRIATDSSRVISVPAFKEKHITAAGHELVAAPSSRFAELLAVQRKVFAARIKPLNLKIEDE